MRISDWSSGLCSSDLTSPGNERLRVGEAVTVTQTKDSVAEVDGATVREDIDQLRGDVCIDGGRGYEYAQFDMPGDFEGSSRTAWHSRGHRSQTQSRREFCSYASSTAGA